MVLSQHGRNVKRPDSRIELAGHVDVPLRGGVALVPHQLLQGVCRQRGGVLRGERSPQIVEPIMPAGVSVLVVNLAGALFRTATSRTVRFRTSIIWPASCKSTMPIRIELRNGPGIGSRQSNFGKPNRHDLRQDLL